MLASSRTAALDVLDLERDVMHAGPPPREEPADGRVLGESGHQLDPSASELKVDGLDPLVFQRATELDLGSEQPPVRLDGHVEILDGHGHVVQRPDLHASRLRNDANSSDSGARIGSRASVCGARI